MIKGAFDYDIGEHGYREDQHLFFTAQEKGTECESEDQNPSDQPVQPVGCWQGIQDQKNDKANEIYPEFVVVNMPEYT